MSNVNVAYVFQGPITEPEKETITQTVQLNLDNKMSGYIEKLKKNNDDSITLKVVIEKNHDPENEVGH
ncbi:MAG: hypothetical protein H6766_03505 [Candidatus Peribacteria bacterium]|nr:MAG: hypothetical protein H6766_03505 [Candidatus Peribacteria bacterium]